MQRYFITAESTYEVLRQSLNAQLAYPNSLGKTVFQTALQAPRDGFRRVLLAVDTDLPNYAAIAAAIVPLLDSDAMEEIDEATYLAAVASATAGASSWNDITGKPTEFPPLFHTHSASAITDFSSAVAAASPEEVVEFLTPAQFPATGNSSLLYIATDDGRAYRWVGSQYAEVGPATLFMQGHTHAGEDIVSGTIAAARLPSSGVSASSLTVGTVATARLGSGTASSSTFLRGDQLYAPTSEVFDFTRTTAPSAATGGSGSWTWTVPSTAKTLRLIAIAGGGGGGSGRRNAAGTARFGGGAGGGGVLADAFLSVAELSTLTLRVTVGAGGAGGASRTTDNQDGASGTSGGLSKVTPDNALLAPALVYAAGGGNGGGGTASAGSGAGDNLRVSEPTNGPVGSSITGTPGGSTGAQGGILSRSATGGGSGGGIDASDNIRSGGGAVRSSYIATDLLTIAQGVGGTAPGGNGTAGGSNGGYTVAGGMGGGGGAAGNSTTVAGNGGNGAYPGGGGGGGGASFNGQNSGAGGNGADGFVRIVVFY